MSLSDGECWSLCDKRSTSNIHRLILTTRTLPALQLVAINVENNGVGVFNATPDGVFVRSRALMSVRRGCVCFCPKLNLEAESQRQSCKGDGTHVKDTKNPVEVQLPGGDRLFVVLRVVTSRDRVPFSPLDDILLSLFHSPDRELGEEIARGTHRWPNSRRQFPNPPEDGPTELICPLSVYHPTEDFADISAG